MTRPLTRAISWVVKDAASMQSAVFALHLDSDVSFRFVMEANSGSLARALATLGIDSNNESR